MMLRLIVGVYVVLVIISLASVILYADAKETMQKINQKESEINPVLKNQVLPLQQYNVIEKQIVIDMKEINANKNQVIDIRSPQKSQK